MIESQLYKNIRNTFSKGCTKNWSKEILIIDSVLNSILWNYKIKYLDGEKVMGSLQEKELLLSKL